MHLINYLKTLFGLVAGEQWTETVVWLEFLERRRMRLHFGVCVMAFVAFSTSAEGGYPPTPTSYGGYGAGGGYQEVKKFPYLPAPPGETPLCAKHGETFCEKVPTYPM